jgi:hypothetical protein
MVVTTLEGGEYSYTEGSTRTFQYRLVNVFNYHSYEIGKVTYGWGTRVVDLTPHFIQLMIDRKRSVFVSNQLAGVDPCPGQPKVLTVTLKTDQSLRDFVSGAKSLTIEEYSLIILL